MKMMSVSVVVLLGCVGCVPVRPGDTAVTAPPFNPDFAVQIVLSQQAKARLAESRSWLVVWAWAFGEPKAGTDPALLDSLGLVALWEKWIRADPQGVVRVANIRVRRTDFMTLARPEYFVTVNVHYLNRTHAQIALECEDFTESIVKLQHTTKTVNCGLRGE